MREWCNTIPILGGISMENSENKKISKRITIEGDKVHQVGYRPFLLAKAIRLRIKNFDAENIEENGKQKVIVSVYGDINIVK